MDKAKIQKIVQELNVTDDYIITFGGSLAVRGIRETHDLDLCVSQKDFERICKETNSRINISVLGQKKIDLIVFDEEVEVFENKEDKECDIIEGIRCQKLDEIIDVKKKFNRPKDIEDINRIMKYIKSK